MIIWNDTLGCHDIKISSSNRARLDFFLGGTSLPNKNVTIEQAETVATTYINNLISSYGYHIYLHIYTMPRKTEETTPFNYLIWIGRIGTEPFRYDWWNGMDT